MASKDSARKWLIELSEIAKLTGWGQLDEIKPNSDTQAISFGRQAEVGFESVTALTYYNFITGQVQRSAFTTNRHGNKKIALRDIPRILKSK